MLLISTQCELTDRPTELYSGTMGGAAQPYYPHPLILLNSLPQTSLTTKIFDKQDGYGNKVAWPGLYFLNHEDFFKLV